MILGHHGGELPLLQAALASAGTVSLLLIPIRSEIARFAKGLCRRPTDHDHDHKGRHER